LKNGVAKRRREEVLRGFTGRALRRPSVRRPGELPGGTFESSKVHFFTLWPFGLKMGPSTKKVNEIKDYSVNQHRKTIKSEPRALSRGGQKGCFFRVGKVFVSRQQRLLARR